MLSLGLRDVLLAGLAKVPATTDAADGWLLRLPVEKEGVEGGLALLHGVTLKAGHAHPDEPEVAVEGRQFCGVL